MVTLLSLFLFILAGAKAMYVSLAERLDNTLHAYLMGASIQPRPRF